jgi:hypothetical protein
MLADDGETDTDVTTGVAGGAGGAGGVATGGALDGPPNVSFGLSAPRKAAMRKL